MTARMSHEPAWTWELNAYSRSETDAFHYARRRSDDGVERHPDGRPCGCPNAAAYAPVTLASAIAWFALAFRAFNLAYPPDIGGLTDPRTPAEVMLAGLITPWDFTCYMLP